jgi:hemerythrin superfamily protein
MGKVKKAKAVLGGLVGVFRVIAEQHGEVAVLLERAKASDEKFTELWPTLKRELLSHEKAELRVVYPALQGNPETQGLAAHHNAEADQLEQLILRIDQLAIGSTERTQLYQQLIDKVLHHANEEESEIFPKAQDALGKDAIEAMEPRFVAAKQQLAAAV